MAETNLTSAITPWFLTGAAGMLGRLMFHAKLAQTGQVKPLSWALFWDIPIALGTGWIALGLCTWSNLGWNPTVSIAIITGYLGPYGIDTMFSRWADSKFGKVQNSGRSKSERPSSDSGSEGKTGSGGVQDSRD